LKYINRKVSFTIHLSMSEGISSVSGFSLKLTSVSNQLCQLDVSSMKTRGINFKTVVD